MDDEPTTTERTYDFLWKKKEGKGGGGGGEDLVLCFP